MKVNKNISDIMSSQSLFLKDKTTFLKNAFSLYLLSSQGQLSALFSIYLLLYFCFVLFFPLCNLLQCLHPTGRGQAVVQGQYAMAWGTTREPGDGPAKNPNPCT